MTSFIKIPTEILQDKKLNHTQILLYGIIMNLSKKEGYCRASNKTLGDAIGVGIWMVQNSIKKLKDEGYISVEIEDNNKRKITVNGYVKYHRGVCEISQGGMGNITPNNNIEYISTKVDIIYPKKNEEDKSTSEDKFEEIWKTYPNYNSRGVKKDARKFFKEKNADELLTSAKIIKWKVELGLEDIQYVKGCHRRIRDFEPPNESTRMLDMKRIFERHMEIGGEDMRERMERLKQDFPDVDFKRIREEISEKNSLLHKLTFT